MWDASCDLDCSGAEHCNLSCYDVLSCDVTCAANCELGCYLGSTTCSLTCDDPSTCPCPTCH